MKTFLYIILSGCMLLLGACSDKVEVVEDVVIAVDKPVVEDITYSSARISVTISSSAPSITEREVCYSTAPNPNTLSNVVKYTGTEDSFSVTLEELAVNTMYYVKAYVIDKEAGLVYSEVQTFSTLDPGIPDELENYEPPTYSDDYTPIADWINHDQWNLANVHDPTVFKAEDGYYYMYQTDASYGGAAEKGGGHFYCRRSKDLVYWEYLGGSMPQVPAWVKEKLNEYRSTLGLDPIESPNYGYWAPVARKVRDGLYRLYYSIVIDNPIEPDHNPEAWGERAFIGLMETSDPASNVWQDKGFVICSSSDKGTDWYHNPNDYWSGYFKWNAIDPSYIITPEGQHWLVYGSWHSGIAAVELDPETGKPVEALPLPWGTADDIVPYGTTIARRNDSRWQGSEGPDIVYRDNYYYLFLAYDAVDVPYNTRVVRSTSILGPYYGIDGTNVSEASGGEAFPLVTHPYKFSNSNGWVGISHCCVFSDEADNWFYASQARLPKDVPGINASNAVMMGHVRRILWTEDGWPLVMPERYGAVPGIPVEEYELAGNWEYIELKYEYATQQTSVRLTLTADHRVTAGPWEGKSWSFDESKQMLLIDDAIKLYVVREVDWERQPRTHTIVFAGYNGQTTHWGKRSK